MDSFFFFFKLQVKCSATGFLEDHGGRGEGSRGRRSRGRACGHGKEVVHGWKECLPFQGPFGRCFAYIYFDTVMISRLLREGSHLRRLHGLQQMLCLLTPAMSSLSARWPAMEPVLSTAPAKPYTQSLAHYKHLAHYGVGANPKTGKWQRSLKCASDLFAEGLKKMSKVKKQKNYTDDVTSIINNGKENLVTPQLLLETIA